ncbi:MAG: LysM peptidoglycan-binding domain-containing protein [Oscillospiraceae bacterium]|nr:LysM peptidoglycan-binding domain-containing protein [Oscillospiraceae bacterium]
MTKRIISLILAVLLFASLGVCAFAEKETETYKVGAETMKMICDKQGLDYEFCKAAIIKLNDAFKSEDDFTSMTVGMSIVLPKTNQAAAEILGVALPDRLKPKATGETITYTIKDKDTMIAICKAKGLTFDKCKAAIMKLNGWNDYSFLNMKSGTTIKLPKTDADAAIIAASTGTATGSATGITPTTALLGNDAVAAYMVPYVVKAGETIYGICQANGIDFNRYVNLIMKASGITYATNLHTGDVIFLPSGSTASGSVSVVAHTVAGGETVYGICQTLGVDYNACYNMIVALNPTKNLNAIHTGDVLYFPSGSTTTAAAAGGTATGGTATAATGGGYSSGYTPAATDPATTPAAFKAKEGVNFYLKEITIVPDDTVYNLVKAAGFDYTSYYANVLLAANKLASFNLKQGDKILMLSSSAAGASVVVKGVKVANGDSVIKMCETAKISYNDNANLIAKLNAGVNFNNLKVGDIILLPVKP